WMLIDQEGWLRVAPCVMGIRIHSFGGRCVVKDAWRQNEHIIIQRASSLRLNTPSASIIRVA
ncbi:MAG: hypothetical protein ACK55Z_05875, partial [bacterium]